MTAHRPFRFGVQASNAPNRSAWVEQARRVEALGYSALTMPDHFTDQFAPVPALMAAADATTDLRVGALVWDNDYKHPVVLAKELATMDVLSDGRVEVGLGAGWMVADYEQSGMPYDTPGVRIDRFVEGLAVMKGLFADDAFSFSGRHYTISNMNGLPKPVQRPGPPFLLGGGGKRVLGIAAREADIVGVNGTLTSGAIGREAIDTMSAEAVDEKVGWVREAAGDRDIEMNVRVFYLSVTDARLSTLEGLAQMFGFTVQQMSESPFALVGTTEQMVEELLARRERWGFSYVVVGGGDIDAFAPVVTELAGR
jgi:probable F420-dependent oxidoreductase